MARKPSGRPTGRPEKPINWDQFQQLCALQCTQPEIASMFHVDEDTIRVRVKKNYGEEYSVIYKRFAESGKASLRRYQFVLARTNASMAIWLGKQWLGQKENSQDIIVTPEAAMQFNAIMNQLKEAQGSRKIAEIKAINE